MQVAKANSLAELGQWHAGHCGTVSTGVGAACRASDRQGAWEARTAAKCLRLCQSCKHCSFVSFSERAKDCSWYAACDLLGLGDSGYGHTTMQVRQTAGGQSHGTVFKGICDAHSMTLHEPLFTRLVHSLLTRPRAVSPGAILDVGSRRGETSCLYATWAPDRLVHAIDPSPNNIAITNRTYGRAFPNLRPRTGALSSRYRARHSAKIDWAQTVLSHADFHAEDRGDAADASLPFIEDSSGRATFPVYTIDMLFANERLGFAHIDVEGFELQVLRGAERTLARDQFLFSFEVHGRRTDMVGVLQPLLQLVDGLGYQMLLVNEVCGLDPTCRNILALPPASLPYQMMPDLDLAVETKLLTPLEPPLAENIVALVEAAGLGKAFWRKHPVVHR